MALYLISILDVFDRELLDAGLKELVTTNPMSEVMTMATGDQAAVAHCQVAGYGVAKDSIILFVHRSIGLPCKYQDKSNIGRQLYVEVLDLEQKELERKNKQPSAAKKQPLQQQLVPSKGALLVALPCRLLATSATTSVVKFSTAICVTSRERIIQFGSCINISRVTACQFLGCGNFKRFLHKTMVILLILPQRHWIVMLLEFPRSLHNNSRPV